MDANREMFLKALITSSALMLVAVFIMSALTGKFEPCIAVPPLIILIVSFFVAARSRDSCFGSLCGKESTIEQVVKLAKTAKISDIDLSTYAYTEDDGIGIDYHDCLSARVAGRELVLMDRTHHKLGILGQTIVAEGTLALESYEIAQRVAEKLSSKGFKVTFEGMNPQVLDSKKEETRERLKNYRSQYRVNLSGNVALCISSIPSDLVNI